MEKQLRGDFLHLAEPFRTAPPAPQQCFVLASGPSLELAINVPKELVHRRLIERSIVIPPPLYRRIVLLGQVSKCCRCLARDAPTPYRLTHARQSIVTRARQETREELELLVLCLPRSKRKTKKGELLVRIGFGIPKPVLSSCRLYTDCRRVRKQVPSRLLPELLTGSSFDSI